MRTRLAWTLTVLAAIAASPNLLAADKPDGTKQAAGEKPNIVFILTDDMGYGDVGCNGGKFVPTPNIDRLAQDGTRFTQFSVASPICSPSRAALTTGMFPARWRLTSYLQTKAGNRACQQADFLDSKAPSVARALKEAGYATAHFGKWHMGGGRDVKNAPPITAYGFDEYASTWESPDPHPDITATNWIWSPKDKVKRWNRTAFFVDKAIDFLRRHQDRPCYVNVWPDDVHTPWVYADDAPKGDTLKNLRPVLAEYDRQIGRLMAGLAELGIAERTVVVFTSDNGPLPTFGRRAGMFRGSKLSLYEGGVREPFIVRWPGHVPTGRVDEQSVLNGVDLFPSFCALAGAALPAGARLDGQDVTSAWFGKPLSRSAPLFWEYGRNNKSFSYPEGRNRSPNVAVREANWKLLVNADGSGAELYDLAVDPGETRNLAAQRPAISGRLRDQALAWRKSLPEAGDTARWSAEKAWAWYKSQPRPCGFNYVPANDISYTEMWMDYGFDPALIDKELALSQDIGFNCVRVFLPFVVWEREPDAFKKRLDTFLGICRNRGLKVMVGLFDDCVFGPLTDPVFGKQPEVIPGWYANGWAPSPGHSMVRDVSTWPRLEKYVKDVIATFGKDDRVWVWDLYNEPTNDSMGKASLPLVDKAFQWAREVNPSQPLTVGVWNDDKALNDLTLQHSDIVTFHNYSPPENLEARIKTLFASGRPLICTEWMNRGHGSTVAACLPIFIKTHVGCMHWGLVNGKTQTNLNWGHRPGQPDPKVWQHDIFKPDYTPVDPQEIQLFRQACRFSWQ